MTKAERAPWLAISFEENVVSIETVVLINRKSCCGERTKNVEIRLANELPPKPGSEMFSGGELLGTFQGPGTDGQRIEIRSSPGWEKKTGFYLIIQMDMGTANFLNLIEVVAYGTIQFYPTGI